MKMGTSHSTDTSNAPLKGHVQTEADAKSVDGNAGKSQQSSHNDKSHTKAGSDDGAGGGKKQERHH
jgi:hypothetical protein